jgi:iron complex transport system permease protein
VTPTVLPAAEPAVSTSTAHPAASGSRTVWRLVALALLAAGALGIALVTGAAKLPLGEVIAALFGRGDELARTIVVDLRLPRALLALLVGGALALAGAVFQALLRNPLAEPYVLGVASGAAVGAVAMVVLGVARAVPAAVPAAAFVGALVALAIVFRIAYRVGRALDTRVLLLAGIVVAAFCNAVMLMLLTIADVESFRSAVFWTMGNLGGARWRDVGIVGAYLAPVALLLLAFARSFNALALGEETAHHLGVRVERVKLAAYAIASLLVAAAVAVCGVIGFVGLIVPHALRLVWGSDHRLLLPACLLGGGTLLMLADTLARTVVAPAELPVGVITALIGVPLFIMLLRRRAL